MVHGVILYLSKINFKDSIMRFGSEPEVNLREATVFVKGFLSWKENIKVWKSIEKSKYQSLVKRSSSHSAWINDNNVSLNEYLKRISRLI